jgi:hypothetical protein
MGISATESQEVCASIKAVPLVHAYDSQMQPGLEVSGFHSRTPSICAHSDLTGIDLDGQARGQNGRQNG